VPRERGGAALPTRARYPAEILTADEVRALITACSNRALTGIRNRALLVLLYRAGCRISEALRLLPKDLDPLPGPRPCSAARAAGGAPSASTQAPLLS
jgi:site-specific recombinase XerD